MAPPIAEVSQTLVKVGVLDLVARDAVTMRCVIRNNTPSKNQTSGRLLLA
jgi:hypothetical protein